MTEATQRPLAGVWWQDPNDNRIHDAEGNDVLDHMSPYEIGRRVNSHDALVAALEAVESNRGTQTCLVCEEYDHTNDCKVRAALEQVK